MEYKLFEKQDIELMKYFVDDENTKYDEGILNSFLEEKNHMLKPDERYIYGLDEVEINGV